MSSWEVSYKQQIVVGGGTAGLALSTRLSQNLPNSSILVIEAGPDGRNISGIYMPGRKGSTLASIYDWNFTTTPQPYANDRVISQNRGRVLGGSSALNLLSYDRATVADYDAWQELGSPGWNFSSIHAASTARETYQLTTTNGSAGIVGVGEGGPIHFLVNRFSPPQQEAFFPTMQNLGLEQTYKFLDGDMLGWMRHTSMILDSNYTRSYSPAFLAEAGQNLHILLETVVQKVNLNNSSRVTGVTLQNGTVINASKEVILSAGSIQSPQLLELSGIGNASILSAAGIKPLVDLSGVGENLQDHPRITTSYQLKPNYTSADILRFNATFAATELSDWTKNISGFYDETGSGYAYLTWDMALGNASNFSSLAEASAVSSNVVDQLKVRNLLDPSKRVPQLEVLFDDGYLGVKGYPAANSSLYGKQFITLIAAIQHPFARGNAHINSSSVAVHPLFNPNYLSNTYDLEAVAQAAKYLRKVASTPPLSDVWVDEYEPGLNNVTTDAGWVEYAKANVQSIWHPIGTCALLPRNESGVVDAELKVYDVKGLRVADASVIPTSISGHIQTAVYAIAGRAAEFIIEEWS
jgi:choline dehydrogenase-like flavoprotein